MLSERDLNHVCQTTQVHLYQAVSIIEMLGEGMTIPFISRYRKEKTGDLDELKVNLVSDAYSYLKELNDRKATVIKTIAEQGKLTDELKGRIEATYSAPELEDLYLPYKPKRRTKASVAREKGLEPLAFQILDAAVSGQAGEFAPDYISEEKGVATVGDALEGAGHIIAEQFAEQAELRRALRQEMFSTAIMVVAVTDEWQEKRSKFEQYYDYKEPLSGMPSHRILAVRRGESEAVLKTRFDLDRDRLLKMAGERLIPPDHPRRLFLEMVMEDALIRLLLPSLESDIRTEMKKNADEEAIHVFARNLENLLLAPPAGNVRVLGVDPGFRTGCKLVFIDETGVLKDFVAIYPHPPKPKKEEAATIVRDWIGKYRIQAVAIGNGTASRESRDFFQEILPQGVTLSVVSEAGASVYSASEAGREEFPDQDVTVRGAVSIARRFQDPLAELVKIEPKAIGVGQYQHDVNQSLLKTKLDQVVISVVNRVGVDLNTASYHLLKYVSGIGAALARSIVDFRNQNGVFRDRIELTQVKKLGAKAFQQCAGFLRIRGGSQPLDATGIHPEAYPLVERMTAAIDISVGNLIGHADQIGRIVPGEFIGGEFGLPTILDILRELQHPGRDPRQDFVAFEFAADIHEISDLAVDMILPGLVTNVTRFGAFVDIGVHQDGLVHVSEISHQFIRSPEEALAVGQKVKVKVLAVDVELKRISLSIKALLPKPEPHPHPPRREKPPKKNRVETDIDALKRAWGSK